MCISNIPMPIEKVLKKTDWPLLAKQKAALIEAKGDTELLDGLLSWMDFLMDAAEEQGYPVVFLGEENGGTA